MSDLLSRLATRVTDPNPPRVVPRPVPRFASDPTGVATRVGPSLAVDDPDGSAPDGRAQAPGDGGGRGGGGDTGNGIPPHAGSTRSAGDPDRAHPSRSRAPADPGAVGLVAAAPPGRPGDDPPTVRRAARTTRPRSGDPNRSGLDTTAADPAGPPTRGRPVAAIAEPRGDTGASDVHPSATGGGVPIAVARPDPPAARAPAATPPVDPPVIQVRIGRLEVRAGAPDPAPVRPRRSDPPASDTTLAEYLRGHRGPR